MVSPTTPIIEVLGLTKEYGSRPAVRDISFTVEPGEIVGLLGPNGAGKSTTLRILAGYLAATQGIARVAGFDVLEQSIEVRRRVGYMPETVPLPDEMRVREYLKFRARLKGLSRAASRERTDTVISRFGLQEVAGRMIAHLSKGFRQRVGLADALVHEPALLILDEPTIGLDPHQIVAVREIIKTLAREHTVLISSHILPEIEVTCSRLLIFHHGRIVAADTRENLQRRLAAQSRITVELAAPEGDLKALWENLAEVSHYHVSTAQQGFRRSVLAVREGEAFRERVAALARDRGWPLRELSESRPTLEDIFVELTHPDSEVDERN